MILVYGNGVRYDISVWVGWEWFYLNVRVLDGIAQDVLVEGTREVGVHQLGVVMTEMMVMMMMMMMMMITEMMAMMTKMMMVMQCEDRDYER